MPIKILKFIFIFSVIFVIAGFVACVSTVSAQSTDILDIEFKTGTSTPLFDKANFLPGNSEARWINVTNKTENNIPIAARAINIYDNGLGEQLILTITEEGDELYSDSLNNFFALDGVYLSDLAGFTAITYNFAVSFNESANNSYQGKIAGFDIVVGDGTNESISGEIDEGGSSSGGYYYNNLIISNEVVTVNNASATISWLTNNPATSRVIYDIISHLNISNSSAPNYGYAYSIAEDLNKTIPHSVIISDLEPATTYYFRPLSKASPEKYGKELSFTTTKNKDETIVLGEEGEPKLEVENIIKEEIVNPGQTGIACEIIISNSGNLPAFDVILTNILAKGFVYNATNEENKNWNIGDINVGEFKSVSYMIDIENNIESGNYTNFAKIYASNHNTVESEASILVQKIKVLSMEFIKSGFNPRELFLLIGVFVILIVLVLAIPKK